MGKLSKLFNVAEIVLALIFLLQFLGILKLLPLQAALMVTGQADFSSIVYSLFIFSTILYSVFLVFQVVFILFLLYFLAFVVLSLMKKTKIIDSLSAFVNDMLKNQIFGQKTIFGIFVRFLHMLGAVFLAIVLNPKRDSDFFMNYYAFWFLMLDIPVRRIVEKGKFF